MLGSTPRPPRIHVVGIFILTELSYQGAKRRTKYEAVDGQSMRKASNHVERRT